VTWLDQSNYSTSSWLHDSKVHIECPTTADFCQVCHPASWCIASTIFRKTMASTSSASKQWLLLWQQQHFTFDSTVVIIGVRSFNSAASSATSSASVSQCVRSGLSQSFASKTVRCLGFRSEFGSSGICVV